MDKTSDRIKKIRKELNLSQREFGLKLGVSRGVISNIEGDVLAKPEQKEPLYKLICREFGVNEKWLMYGEGEMYEEEDLYARAAAEIARDDPQAQEIITKYWQLTPEEKEMFWKFLRKITGKEKDGQ